MIGRITKYITIEKIVSMHLEISVKAKKIIGIKIGDILLIYIREEINSKRRVAKSSPQIAIL